MYRHCIYCSGDLGTNEAVEAFPVGRTLAFDAAQGRLWAVCRKCARWNLAPIEERWEPVEAAERLFRDARLRVQSENIGLAQLPDGTRLICVGAALQGELAAWRYGDQLVKRRRRHLVLGGAAVATGVIALGGFPFAAAGVVTYCGAESLGRIAWRWYQSNAPLYTVAARETPARRLLEFRRKHLRLAVLQPGPGGGIELLLRSVPASFFDWDTNETPIVLPDRTARRVLERGLVHVNVAGANHEHLNRALGWITSAGSAEDYIRARATHREVLPGAEGTGGWAPNETLLALEIALHEEQERRAMQGELAVLEAAWRDAEPIAAIADRLALEP